MTGRSWMTAMWLTLGLMGCGGSGQAGTVVGASPDATLETRCVDDTQCGAVITGSPCAVGRCVAGTCSPRWVEGCCTSSEACDDQNPCTIDLCQSPAGGAAADARCHHAPWLGPCDDGQACTADDACVDGQCTGQPFACAPCQRCDGQACVMEPGFCWIDETCVSAQSPRPDAPCWRCAPDHDPHAWSPRPAGTGCDDGEPCTQQDACDGQGCVGTPRACDDQNPCTTDACLLGHGCQFTPNLLPVCDDGDACTVGDHCVQGACEPTAATPCDDQNPCTADTCAPEQGCINTPQSGPCDDNNACTGPDQCAAGSCASGKALPCDDGDACTSDICAPETGCASGPALACDDQNPCTDDLCEPASGTCQFLPNQAPCQDGAPCTGPDTCQDGACVAGPPLDCDDGYTSTTDVCDPQLGCVSTPIGCGLLGVDCPEGFDCTPQGTCENATEVFVPAGDFAKRRYPFFPYTDIRSTVAFAIDRQEASVADYKLCVSAGACTKPTEYETFSAILRPISTYYWSGSEDLPVSNLTADQAAGYCAWRGKQLPTVHQRIKAGRGGCSTMPGECVFDARLYPWGNALPTCARANFDSLEFVNSLISGCGTGGPWEVDGPEASASPYGALNLIGNVSEWTVSDYEVIACGGGFWTGQTYSLVLDCVPGWPQLHTWPPSTGSIAVAGVRCARTLEPTP